MGEIIVVRDYRCWSCHGDDFSGSGYYPNLTSDPIHGLGSWSDEAIARAIRNGFNEVGQKMCPLMPQYPFDDQKVADVVAFLRTLPAVAKPITGVCPGHGI